MLSNMDIPAIFAVVILANVAAGAFVPSSLYKRVQGGDSWSNFCVGLPDGLYPEPSSGCRLYYFCYQQTSFISRCPAGTAFDPARGGCTSEDLVLCSPPTKTETIGQEVARRVRACASLPSGVFADRSQGCKKYFACAGGRYMGSKMCSPGLVFDENTQTCVEGAACVTHDVTMRRQQRQVKFDNFFPQEMIDKIEEYTRQLEDRLERRGEKE